MRGWIEWFAKGLWRRRRGVQIIIGISATFTLLVLWQNRDIRPERTMTDPEFVDAANELCVEQVRPLAEQRRSSGESSSDTPAANAKKVDRVADKLEAAVADLRALPHKPANDAKIEAWLADFDDYIDAGRNYADALRTGDEEKWNAVDDQGVAPLKAIANFARANHIDSCIP